jgi:hypothetical protein
MTMVVMMMMMMMSVQQSVEFLVRGTEILGGNLSQCRFVPHKIAFVGLVI